MPDVLVTDVVMPRLDGFGLVGAVRRLYPDIPVIIMTGDATYQDRPIEALAAEVGAVATFLKPFDLAELHQAVRGVVSPGEPASFARDGAGAGAGERGTGRPERPFAPRRPQAARPRFQRRRPPGLTGGAPGAARPGPPDASRRATRLLTFPPAALLLLLVSRHPRNAQRRGSGEIAHPPPNGGASVKISRIDVYRFRYTLAGGPLTLSGGRTVSAEDSTLVKISTDEGLVGWGEGCPFNPTYMLAFPEGTRAAIQLMGPALLGADPRQIEQVYARMDGVLYGHAYAKSPIDIACWDLLGQATGLPVSDLLGGTFQARFPIYHVVGVNRPEAMRDRAAELRSQGFRRYQIKVGSGHWQLDVARARACLDVVRDQEVVIVDANAYWRQHEAAQFIAALEDEPIYLEQPCRTLPECLAIRRRTARPMILDETLTDLDALFAAQAAGAMDCAMLKLSRLGGISRVRLARDVCRQWGLAMTMEDAGGGDVVTAAMAHLAASTPPQSLLNGMLINMMVNEHVAEGTPEPRDGWSEVSRRPGLGITVDEKALGEPVFSIR